MTLITTKARTVAAPFTAPTLFNPSAVQMTIKHEESGRVVVDTAALSSASKGKWSHVWQSLATSNPGVYTRHVFVDGSPYDDVAERAFQLDAPEAP